MQTLPEQIADRLRRDILRGKLRPGETLKERDNAADLGVSRTPLREAIRLLARDGLVVLRPARSPLVADPSLKEVTDDLAVMQALEVLSGRLACQQASEAELRGIRKLHERIAAEFDRTDPLDLFELDMSFHRAIANASHNGALAATHGAYLARLWRARYLSAIQRRSRDRVITQHGAIVSALELRDPDATAAALDEHLYHLEPNIAAVYRDAGDPYDDHETERTTG